MPATVWEEWERMRGNGKGGRRKVHYVVEFHFIDLVLNVVNDSMIRITPGPEYDPDC